VAENVRHSGLFSGAFALDPITGSNVFGDIGIVVHGISPLAAIVWSLQFDLLDTHSA
jgi:hypothetical protein